MSLETLTTDASPSGLIYGGAPVFTAEGQRIGQVDDISIDKRAGEVGYAGLGRREPVFGCYARYWA